jgi:hypothetical protein
VPVLEMTPDALLEVAKHVRNNQVETLSIRQRKGGKNKGKTFIDYQVREDGGCWNSQTQMDVLELLETAAKHMFNGTLIAFEMIKDKQTGVSYRHYMETKS